MGRLGLMIDPEYNEGYPSPKLSYPRPDDGMYEVDLTVYDGTGTGTGRSFTIIADECVWVCAEIEGRPSAAEPYKPEYPS